MMFVGENAIVRAYFPHLSRMNSDFSAAYLDRELQAMAASPPQVVFLGDSVLWGLRLKPQQIAVSLLAAKGCGCRNLSFKASSPPNYFALTELLLHYNVHPKFVVLEIDQRVFNQANHAYQTLHPAVAQLAEPMLSSADRKILRVSSPPKTLRSELDRLASSLFLVYAMRADIRETLYPLPDKPAVQHPTAGMFEGEYDLTPLSDANAGVRYLEKTADALHAARIPALAFMTPTNHALLHDYINGPEYRANLIFLKRLLDRRGVRVIDLDRAFGGGDFYDYAHLRPAAQVRLAAILERELPR
jgi:hypothetical protein